MSRTHNLLGQHTHSPRSILQLMARQLGHKTTRILAVESPVDVTLQLGRGHLTTPVIVSVPVVSHAHNIANHTLVDHLHSLDVLGIEQALLTDEKHTAQLLAAVIYIQRLIKGEGH